MPVPPDGLLLLRKRETGDEEEVEPKNRIQLETHRPTTLGLPSSVIKTRAVSRKPLDVAASDREGGSLGLLDGVNSDDDDMSRRWCHRHRCRRSSILSSPLFPAPPPRDPRDDDGDDAMPSRAADTAARRARIRKLGAWRRRGGRERKREGVILFFGFFSFVSHSLTHTFAFVFFQPRAGAGGAPHILSF